MSDSFKKWLLTEIRDVLLRPATSPPFLLWCDPHHEWLDLLRASAASDDFELWAPKSNSETEHELIIRDRFFSTERAPRVVWLGCDRHDITWFKPFELEAEEVWEKTLLEALREYGVHIPREQEGDLVSLLPAHARQWLDQPKEVWQKELTPSNVKGGLLDDHRMLEALAGEEGEFDRLRTDELFDIFARRAKEDFGLPDPSGMNEEAWRISATACLLCTDAAHGSPTLQPSELDKIIPSGLARNRALSLLKQWQNHVQLIPSFERLVPQAEATIGLTYWARNLTSPPRSRSSRVVEEMLFAQMADRLERIENVDSLAVELEGNLQAFKDRETGFWGRQAAKRIGWRFFVELANVAALLVENAGAEKHWKTATDAVEWYSSRGWQLDQAGEQLFKESADLPTNLHRIRARLRRGYLRMMDRAGRGFSELLAKDSSKVFALPTAGEAALSELQRTKTATAIVFLDACRLELGHRLSQLLNQGEPTQRATVATAVAPIPSITALGMAFALPMEREQIQVSLSSDKKSFVVSAEGFDGNLAIAEQRRKWLTENFGVKDFLNVKEVIDGSSLKRASKSRQMVVVHSDEFDSHDGKLEMTGADTDLQRYVQTVRRLRDAGYNRVIVTTDHGFFHWQPDDDEIDGQKPAGKLQWQHRRAMVGYKLTHPQAIHLKVSQSDLEAMVPRSVSAFRTYGGLGFFHGGATLQELIIPTVVAQWPAKAKKINVVLKPVQYIASEIPRVQVQAGATGQITMFGPDSNLLARDVVVKVKDPSTGKVVFKHADPVTIEPQGEVITVPLSLVDPRPQLAFGTTLNVQLLDADDEEILAQEEVTLRTEINDEW